MRHVIWELFGEVKGLSWWSPKFLCSPLSARLIDVLPPALPLLQLLHLRLLAKNLAAAHSPATRRFLIHTRGASDDDSDPIYT